MGKGDLIPRSDMTGRERSQSHNFEDNPWITGNDEI